jgi:hypothetical protein
MNGETEMVMNFTMAIGWFVDVTRSVIDLEANMTWDSLGLPDTSNDWVSTDIDPVVNKMQLRYNLADVPSPCFVIAMKLTVVKLDFFSGVDANSVTTLYGYNTNWDEASSSRTSSSPFVTPWCPFSCAPDPADCTRDYLTWSACQYGVCGADGPAATYRDANFAGAFPNGLTFGCDNGFSATVTNAAAVTALLPSQGNQDVLSQNYTDPTGRVGGNTSFNFCADWNSNQACGTVDFNTDGVVERGGGNALVAGQEVTNQWQDDIDMTISGESNNSNRSGRVIIFDSNNPTGGDTDLGTPNQAFGGAGVGSGGASGSGVNNVNEGNLIILAENITDNNSDGLVDNPDDDAAGGVITFDFATPTTVQAFTMVDLDDNANNQIKIYFADNRAPLTIQVPNLGDNSRRVVLTKEGDNSWADGVVKVEIRLSGSGGIAGFCFCNENPYSGNACIQNSGSADIRSTLISRVVTATLNVGFDAFDPAFGGANFPFGFMVVRNGTFAGMTVNEVITAANDYVGGCSTTYTRQELNGALNNINKSFLGGSRQNNYLICPSI